MNLYHVKLTSFSNTIFEAFQLTPEVVKDFNKDGMDYILERGIYHILADNSSFSLEYVIDIDFNFYHEDYYRRSSLNTKTHYENTIKFIRDFKLESLLYEKENKI